jgi:HK97 family phage major capsid protein
MTVSEILAALQGIIAEAMPDAADMAADPAAAPQLNEDQAARYEALEAKLLVARKSEEIVKRNAAYNATATNVPVASGIQVSEDREVQRAFREFLVTGRPNNVIKRAGQTEGSGPAGGFLVPESFRGKLIEKMKAFGGLQNEAESFSTATGQPVYWLTNDDALSTEAGITTETGNPAYGADFVFGKSSLSAYKYTTGGAVASNADWLKVSWELLQDGEYDIEGFIARKFAERIARKLSVDLISGSGVNEPQGIISTQGALPSSGVTLASATAPTYAELLTIVHSLDPAYRDGAKWLMNDASVAALQGVLDGNNRPLLWNLNGSMADGLGQTLLGFPIVVDQAMPTMTTGSVKGYVFGQLAETYVVRSVKDFTLVTAHELFAANGQVGYRGWARYDGMVQNANAAVYATSHA